jgi:hypothetical protein
LFFLKKDTDRYLYYIKIYDIGKFSAVKFDIYNQRGYAGTSLNDIIADTGIKKGGIYRHFTNKDEIALEAYNYAQYSCQQIC